MNNKHYIYLDLLRVLSLLGVLLYHINLLKGGYLAVCIFFVLSGYLSILSISNKKEFNIKEYYKKKFIKLYIPLLITVFITLTVVSMFNLEWINLKAETKSVLLFYNNYWQLNANLDYFVRLISSPFMHLWYISILFQFELLFPLLYLGYKKIEKKINKKVLLSIIGITTLLSIIIFTTKVINNNLMGAYYGTFSRIYSILLGLGLGIILINRKDKKETNIKQIYLLGLIVLILLFVIIDFKSILFVPSMILTSLISLLLIYYGTKLDNNKILDRIISPISKISYEIYLIQYPVIFFFQSIDINYFIKIPLIILITISLSIILHIPFEKNNNKYLKIVISVILLGLSLYGLIPFVKAKDNTKDMNKLKNDLSENSELIEKKQKEYQEKLKNDENDWKNKLNEYDTNEQNLKETVRNLRIVGIGDSIMELAIKNLYEVFPNGYFDAVENRTEKQGRNVIEDLDNQGILGDVLLLNIGTNGSCLGECKENLMETIGNRKVYWLNATNPDYDTFNPSLYDIASKHSNIRIIDWVSVANEHPEYLIYDKVHPTVTGCRIYAETIFNAIYEDYLKELQENKEATIKQHEEEQNKKITFIGNDLLIGGYDYLSEEFPDSNFISDKDLTYKKLIDIIDKNKNKNTISNNLVLMIDQKLKLSDKEYKEIIKKTIEYHLLVVEMNKYNKLNNVKTIKFYEELEKHPEYLSYDNIHLTEKGYKVLTSKIKDSISE